MAELKEQAIQRNKETDNWMVSVLNEELYWTGWYAVSGNNIQWTIATRDILDKRAKKSK